MRILNKLREIIFGRSSVADNRNVTSAAFRDESRSLRFRYPQYQIGRWTYGQPKIHDWGSGGTLKIGAFTSIGPGVQILLGGEHDITRFSSFPFHVFWKTSDAQGYMRETKGDVVIGSDVWIGLNAVILSGVTIGDGAVIGAGSIISGNVPPYAVVCGNPQQIIKMRFDELTINRLLEIKWWNWADDKIEANIRIVMGHDVNALGELDSIS